METLRKEPMYASSESDLRQAVCAINLGQVADEGSATSYKVRPPLFTATYLQFYNKSSQAVRDNCVGVCGRQLLGPRIGSISDL